MRAPNTSLRYLLNLRTASLLLAVAIAGFGAPRLSACDACNVAFGTELESERGDSLIARDMRAAFENQRDLVVEGMGSGAFKPKGAAPAPQVAVDESTHQPVEDAQAEAVAPAEAPEQTAAVQPEAASQPEESAQPQQSVQAQAAQQQTQAQAGQAQRSSGAAAGTRATAGGGARPVPGPAPYSAGERQLTRYDVPAEWGDDPFIEIIERDYNLPIPPTSYVPQDTEPDVSFTLEMSEGRAYIGNGVVYDGFLTNNTVPGPLLVVEEGDIVEIELVNNGTISHGASIHAADTQTSKYLGYIEPGQSGRVVFRASQPGVYLYHCAPGGHAIPMHVLFGQYGMMVVKPKSEVYEMERIMGRAPDVEIYLVQHEFYDSGRDAVNSEPAYTTFNGKLFRYVEEPIQARPGDFVRIYFLNAGPNLLSTFHIVGIIWDYVYWQGQPSAVFPGGQSVTAGPTDSFVIDFRIPPDEGSYTMLTHAVGSATRGAIGLISAKADAERHTEVRPEGLFHTPEEMDELVAQATRTISPFKPTNVDEPVRYPPGTKEVTVQIIGNSYYPKVIEIEPGTTVRWVNEDVFTFLAGEFAGIHNAQSVGGDDDDYFVTPLLAHGESATHTFMHEAEYDYICAPHPYMQGRIVVKQPEIDFSQLGGGGDDGLGGGWLLPLVVGAFLVSLLSLYLARSPRQA